MLFGNKIGSQAHHFGNKVKNNIKFGSKRIHSGLHKFNSVAVPALSVVSPAGAGALKTTEAVTKMLGNM